MGGRDGPVALRDLAAWGRSTLRGYSEDPSRDAYLLLALAIGKPPEHIHLHPESRHDKETVDRYRSLVMRRREGEPVAYIRGYQPFMGHDFVVNRRVLIPRPETETLVEEVVRFIGSVESAKCDLDRIAVADICCGSGAVGLSIARAFPRVGVVLTDLSDEALMVARENAAGLGLTRVTLLQGDLFEPLRLNGVAGLDVIASNPPYIESLKMCALPAEVKREPRMALDGGPDGLHYVRRLIAGGMAFLRPGGMMAVEIDEDQARPVELAFHESSGWTGLRFVNDLAGRIRVVVAYRSSRQ